MQRTTVRLPEELLEAAKDCARHTRRTLTQLLHDAVHAELARAGSPAVVAERSPRYGVRHADRTSDNATFAYATSSQPNGGSRVVVPIAAQVLDIQEFLRSVPDRDLRSPEEILAYDANGLPR